MNFLKQTFAQFSKNRCTTLAAALAYYTAFALPPLLYLLMVVLTFGLSVAYDSETAEQKAQSVLRSQAAQMLGNQSASEQIGTIMENQQNASGKWWKTLLGLAGMIAGATGVVAALQDSLNQVWGVKPDPETAGWLDFIKKRVLSFAMIMGLGFLLLASLVVSSVLAGMSSAVGIAGATGEWINLAVQAIVILIMFAMIFKYMPDAVVRWSHVMIGATLTTLLFLAGRYAMQWYFSVSEPGAQLGAAAASLAVLLVWVYYTAIIVLLGAVATQVFATLDGSSIRPEVGAVRVVKTLERPDPSTDE